MLKLIGNSQIVKQRLTSRGLIRHFYVDITLGFTTTSRRPFSSWVIITQTTKVDTGHLPKKFYGLTPNQYG